MGREDRHGIAEDQVVAPVEDSFLTFGKMIQAEETGPVVSITSLYDGRTALYPSRVVLEADGESLARQVPFSDRF